MRFIKSYDEYHTLLQCKPVDLNTRWTDQVRAKVECTTTKIARASIYLRASKNTFIKHNTYFDGNFLLQTLMSLNTRSKRDCIKREKNMDARLSAHAHLWLVNNTSVKRRTRLDGIFYYECECLPTRRTSETVQKGRRLWMPV